MPSFLPQDFRNRMGADERLIPQCIHAAFSKYLALVRLSGGEYGKSIATRTRAGILHDYVIEEATNSLPFEHILSNGVHLWQKQDMVFRFKKLNDFTGLPSNISTAHNDSLCNSGAHPPLFEYIKPSYLTIGYDVANDWKSLGDMWAMYMVDERHYSWTLQLRSDGRSVAMDQYIPEVATLRPRSRVASKDVGKKPKEG